MTTKQKINNNKKKTISYGPTEVELERRIHRNSEPERKIWMNENGRLKRERLANEKVIGEKPNKSPKNLNTTTTYSEKEKKNYNRMKEMCNKKTTTATAVSIMNRSDQKMNKYWLAKKRSEKKYQRSRARISIVRMNSEWALARAPLY